MPSARLLQADACALPIGDAAVSAVVSANLLEHIPDDDRALREMARIVTPGGRVVIVVPAGPRTYDYYDRFLGHVRRYACGELASKCERAGLEPLEDVHVAALLYPAFWVVKQRNRARCRHLSGAALASRVAAVIGAIHNSRLGYLAGAQRICSSAPVCGSHLGSAHLWWRAAGADRRQPRLTSVSPPPPPPLVLRPPSRQGAG